MGAKLNTEADFVAKIVADPAADAPRKAYADWLVAQGDVRGEVMHLVLRPKLNKKQSDRLNEIYEAACPAIEGDIPKYGGIAQIDRGMVDALYIGVTALLKHGDRWFAQHPITELKINNSARPSTAQLKKLGASPILEKLRKLEIDITNHNFAALWETKRFTKLEFLELTAIGVKPSPSTLADLTKLRGPKLREIRFYCVQDVVKALAALAANKTLPKLEAIEVDNGETEWRYTPKQIREEFAAPAKR